jgi:hypothetical protein
MEGSEIRELIKGIIREVDQESALAGAQTPNVQGTVVSVGSDGTVSVSTSLGVFQGIGSPRSLIVGEEVVIITADGQKVAL